MDVRDKELEAFAYVASHDMREPLRKIQSFGAILAENMDGNLDEESAYCLQGMVEGADRLAGMLDGLLLYSRAARSAPNAQGCDLNGIVQEVLDEMGLRNDTEVHCGHMPWVPADPLQMKVLFQQLLDNAHKFRSPERPLVVRLAWDPASDAGITVNDNGIGFDPKDTHKLFTLFGRLHGRAEGYAGNGMGLAVCNKIIQVLGGSIQASGEPGVGSEIRMHIPGARRVD